jgi:Rps23 Pro-64 3,4-dihydroxylase Tpa1-like proline 4-hydroxylase
MNQKQLKIIANNCADKILTGGFYKEPYKHLIVNNFLPDDLVQKCLQSFPKLDDKTWQHENDTNIEVKSRTTWQSEFDIPDNIVDSVRILNSSLILNSFSEIFGIKRLVPDPYFSGGGLNITKKGGLLDVHIDGNYHDASGLNRRVNALIYLNPGWQESWGGELGIYNSNGTQLIKKIEPLFNRLVVFDSHDYSYHGLPDPVNFPDGINRKSIILYYYTKDSRPDSQTLTEDPHSALWVKKGIKDKLGNFSRSKYE